MPNTDSSPTYTTDNAKRTLDDFSLNHPIEKISISAPSPVSSECSQISVSEPDSPPSHSTSPRSAPTEDNLDQLLAAIISKPRLSRAKTEKGSAPFWYGSEDTDHIRNIMAQYALQMGVDANRPKNSRCPLKFIGSIKRQAMEQPSNSTTFSTLDEVSIYVRDFFPLGHPLTAAQTQHVLVSWDREEGLPVKMQKLTESEYRRKQLVCTPSSATFLHCLPIFENSTDFSYSADKSPRSIGYHSSKADDLCLIQDIKVTKEQLQSESRQPDVFVEEFEEEDDTPEDPEINGLSPVDEELKDSPPRSAFALPCSIRDADLSDFEPSQIRFSVSIGFEFTASEPSAAPSKKKSPKANSSASAKDADADCMFPMDFEDSHNFSVTHIGFEFQSDSFDDEFDGADQADDNEEEEEEEEDQDSEQIDDSEEALEDFDFGFSFGPTASFHPPSLGRSQSQRSPARPIQSSKPASGSKGKGKGDDKKMSRSFEEELAGLMASFGGR